MVEKIYKISELLKIWLNQKTPLGNLISKGGSIASNRICYCVKEVLGSLDLIIDVGANQGQFAKAARYYFPNSIIHSFEPSEKTFKILQRNTARIKDIHLHNLGLGNQKEVISFFENEYSHASSILPTSDYQKEALPHVNNVKEIKISVDKLDNIFSEKELLNRKTLLKLDVQGYEKHVIEGASSALNNIDYLLIEVSFIPMYNGELLFNEMNLFLQKKGFELIRPVGLLESKDLQILQMDMLYKKA